MKLCRCLALVAVLFAGCVRDEFTLELTPADDALDRTLIVVRHQARSPDEIVQETQRLAKEYRIAVPPPPTARQAYRARFSKQMPDDIGGYGTYVRWGSPLGSVMVYAERFRGNDDTSEIFKRRETAARRVSELLVGWLATEMKDEAGWPTLQAFLKQEFRRDLLNVSLRTVPLILPDRKEAWGESAVHLFQYLIEHGYFTADDLPALRRAFDDAGREDFERLLTWIRKLMIARMGDVPPPKLEFLATRQKLEESLRGFLETTDDYRILTEAWLEKRATDPAAEKPDAIMVLGEVSKPLYAGMFRLGGDQLTVKLQTGKPPISTNGNWSDDTEDVHWPQQLLPVEDMSPLLTFAIWDDPDEAAQTAIFGETVLRGHQLFDYCVWYRGLSEEERQEWDAFLDELPAGEELIEKLKGFHFKGEPALDDVNRRIANPAVEAILKGLSP
jgi:hypothetical protein